MIKAIIFFSNFNMLRDFTYIGDIVEGILHVMPNPASADEFGNPAKVYNIGNNHTETLMHFIEGDCEESCVNSAIRILVA